MKDKVQSTIRGALIGLGGYLVHKGWADSATVDAAASGLAQVGAGVAMGLFSQLWAYVHFDKILK